MTSAIHAPIVIDDGFDADGNEWLDFDLDEDGHPALGLVFEGPCALCGKHLTAGFACVSDAAPDTDIRIVCAEHIQVAA